MRTFYFLTALSLAISGSALHAQTTVTKPAAPSELKVRALGVNSFEVRWKDNSTNESGFEILLAVKGTKPEVFTTQLANYIGKVVITNPLPGKDLVFQVRAYTLAADGKKLYSKKTPVVTATALSPAVFNAPTKLKAKAVDDGQILLRWKDNATTETAYSIEYKETKKKKWEVLGSREVSSPYKVPTYGFDPKKSYSFRVRAVSTAGLTPYSNEASATTKALQAPSKLVVKSEGDGKLSFKWKDNSSLENGFELYSKVGSGNFTLWAPGFLQPNPFVANATSTTALSFTPDTTYQFRLRGYRTVDNKKVYTGYTNTVTIKNSNLAAPTTLAGSAVSDSSVKLTWKDVSTREASYQVQYRLQGSSTFTDTATTTGSAKEYTLTGLIPGKTYEFRIRAYSSASVYSAYTSIVAIRTKDGIAGDLNPPLFFGEAFTYTIDVSRASALTNLTVGTMPAGLAYNGTTRVITGSPSEDGVKSIPLKATFSDGSVIDRTLVLRIIRKPAAPVVAAAFANVNVAAGATSNVSTDGKFADPDTASAVRVATTKGPFDVILYKDATPDTVTNFLSYVTGGKYTNMFFHRSISNVADKLLIVQGGGFTYSSADGFKQIAKIGTAKLKNEPGISNLRGTIAMAKVAGDPDSATSQFFVNADDVNAGNLDDQNGGFTVFGRVPESGMDVVDAINDLPTKTYTLTGLSGSFSDLPMDAAVAPVVMEPDKLVKVTSVTTVPALSYEVATGNAAVATATVSTSGAVPQIVIAGVGAGSTTITVTARDLDGQTVSQTINVTVP